MNLPSLATSISNSAEEEVRVLCKGTTAHHASNWKGEVRLWIITYYRQADEGEEQGAMDQEDIKGWQVEVLATGVWGGCRCREVAILVKPKKKLIVQCWSLSENLTAFKELLILQKIFTIPVMAMCMHVCIFYIIYVAKQCGPWRRRHKKLITKCWSLNNNLL